MLVGCKDHPGHHIRCWACAQASGIQDSPPDPRDARIAELEAAIRLITYRSDCGSEVGVYPAQREHVNLMNIAPVLATVWPDN